MENNKRHIGKWTGISALLLVVLYSCASIGTPDGGIYDEIPPKVVGSTPALNSVNNKEKKIAIEFDEYIKLESAYEKVVVSPPQLEQPEIKVSSSGKRILVELQDTLKENTTYTIDFSDAIVDNNESNPMGNFTFTFSTGEIIDTLEVAGKVLNASNLEPIKSMLVGLYANLEDSAFTTLPFERVARTDPEGKFTIRGVAPGTYRIYALNDADQNYYFSQKSEMLAFNEELIVPSFEFATRKDTLSKDSIVAGVDSIRDVRYTRFLPDDVVLLAFQETATNQYMAKRERLTPTKFSFYFAAPADTLPTVEGMNFDEKDAFVIEHSLHNDTIHYWIKDTLVSNLDTLSMRVSYLYTDTLNQLVPCTDTIHLASKLTQARIKKEADDKMEEWNKELKKRRKRKGKDGEVFTDTIPPVEFLKIKVDAPSTFDLTKDVTISFEEPLSKMDTACIHLNVKVDTLWEEIPYRIRMNELNQRTYTLHAEWRPEQEYKLVIDSLAFYGLYGKFTNKTEQTMKVRGLNEYSALFLNIPKAGSKGVVQLMNEQEGIIRQQKVVDGKADIFFLIPGKYYLRLFMDENGNGTWDTGLYEEKLQAEKVYYYPSVLELRAMWEVEQDWDLDAVPLINQKPEKITKQKKEEKKNSAHTRNEERMKEKNK